jgi:hypothetical protein
MMLKNALSIEVFTAIATTRLIHKEWAERAARLSICGRVVRWSVGALERWSVGALERWSVGALDGKLICCHLICLLLGGCDNAFHLPFIPETQRTFLRILHAVAAIELANRTAQSGRTAIAARCDIQVLVFRSRTPAQLAASSYDIRHDA